MNKYTILNESQIVKIEVFDICITDEFYYDKGSKGVFGFFKKEPCYRRKSNPKKVYSYGEIKFHQRYLGMSYKIINDVIYIPVHIKVHYSNGYIHIIPEWSFQDAVDRATSIANEYFKNTKKVIGYENTK